jgi:hypothetical protein
LPSCRPAKFCVEYEQKVSRHDAEPLPEKAAFVRAVHFALTLVHALIFALVRFLIEAIRLLVQECSKLSLATVVDPWPRPGDINSR